MVSILEFQEPSPFKQQELQLVRDKIAILDCRGRDPVLQRTIDFDQSEIMKLLEKSIYDYYKQENCDTKLYSMNLQSLRKEEFYSQLKRQYSNHLEMLKNDIAELALTFSNDIALKQLSDPSLQEFKQQRIIQILKEFWDEQQSQVYFNLMQANSMLKSELNSKVQEIYQRDSTINQLQQKSAREGEIVLDRLQQCQKLVKIHKDKERAYVDQISKLKLQIEKSKCFKTQTLSYQEKPLISEQSHRKIESLLREQEDFLRKLGEKQKQINLLTHQNQAVKLNYKQLQAQLQISQEELESLKDDKLKAQIQYQKVIRTLKEDIMIVKEHWEKRCRELQCCLKSSSDQQYIVCKDCMRYQSQIKSLKEMRNKQSMEFSFRMDESERSVFELSQKVETLIKLKKDSEERLQVKEQEILTLCEIRDQYDRKIKFLQKQVENVKIFDNQSKLESLRTLEVNHQRQMNDLIQVKHQLQLRLEEVIKSSSQSFKQRDKQMHHLQAQRNRLNIQLKRIKEEADMKERSSSRFQRDLDEFKTANQVLKVRLQESSERVQQANKQKRLHQTKLMILQQKHAEQKEKLLRIAKFTKKVSSQLAQVKKLVLNMGIQEILRSINKQMAAKFQSILSAKEAFLRKEIQQKLGQQREAVQLMESRHEKQRQQLQKVIKSLKVQLQRSNLRFQQSERRIQNSRDKSVQMKQELKKYQKNLQRQVKSVLTTNVNKSIQELQEIKCTQKVFNNQINSIVKVLTSNSLQIANRQKQYKKHLKYLSKRLQAFEDQRNQLMALLNRQKEERQQLLHELQSIAQESRLKEDCIKQVCDQLDDLKKINSNKEKQLKDLKLSLMEKQGIIYQLNRRNKHMVYKQNSDENLVDRQRQLGQLKLMIKRTYEEVGKLKESSSKRLYSPQPAERDRKRR